MLTHGRNVPWPLRPVGALKPVPDQVQMAGIGGGKLVLVTDSAIYVGPAAPGAQPSKLMDLDWPPGRLAVSPSGRFALLRSRRRDQVAVIDLERGRCHLSAERVGRPCTVTATFSRVSVDEVLVLSRSRHFLQVLDLTTGDQLASAKFLVRAFMFNSLHPMLDADIIIALGHGESESKDSFFAIALTELIQDPAAATARMICDTSPSDYAYRLAVGTCGPGAMVAYRNPEDDELPDDDGNYEPPTSDVEGLCGFYVRRLDDNGVVEHIPYNDPVTTGAPIFATDSVVVVGGSDKMVFVPRARAYRSSTTEYTVSVYAFDPASNLIAVVGPERTAELFEISASNIVPADEG